MTPRGRLLVGAVAGDVIIVAGTVEDYWRTLERVERDQQAAGEQPAHSPKARRRKGDAP